MRKVAWMVIATAFLALPVFAADNVIYRGVDLWDTTNDGSTFIEFARQPIPAGFFCQNSESFTGRVALQGVSVATGRPGELGSADTIVERLDDAAFNKKGIATTRIQVRALQLESIAPLKTACGSFKLQVRLEGAQPITRMQIVRENKQGGRFKSPISIRSKLFFIPVSGPQAQPLELSHSVNFPGNPRVPWSFKPGWRGVEKRGPILVDTNFDSLPDTFLPGTSNFAGGWRSLTKAASVDCHVDIEDHAHCVGVPIDQ